jgi:hypothetical protein
MRSAVDAWAVKQDDEPGRSEAILRAPVHGDQGFRLKATTVSGG